MQINVTPTIIVMLLTLPKIEQHDQSTAELLKPCNQVSDQLCTYVYICTVFIISELILITTMHCMIN